MAKRYLQASLSSSYTDTIYKDEETILYGVGATSDPVAEGTIKSAVLGISKFRVLSSSCYLDVYVGGTKVAETVEMDWNDYGSTSVQSWIDVELEYLEPELLTATGSIKLVCHNNKSSTANTYGTDSSGWCEIAVEYDEPVIEPLIQWSKNFSVSQEDYKVRLTWDKATPINGAGSISYAVEASYTKDGQSITKTVYSGSSTSILIEPPEYGIAVSYCVFAFSSGALNSGTGSSGKSLTITLPEITHYTVKCYLNGAWQDCLIYYYDGSNWIECIAKYYDGTQWNECSF